MRFITIFYFICITEFIGLAYHYGKIASKQIDYKGYFTNRREITDSYGEIADLVNDKGYENIGLFIGGDSYEYPLTVMLKNYKHIEHVNVTNETEKYENWDFVPDVIISIDYDLPQGVLLCHNNEYEITEEIAEGIYLLVKVING